MAVDTEKEIRRAVDTGKTVFGERESEKSILKGNSRLIIISRNATISASERIEHLCNVASVPVYKFSGEGIELGAVCGKPFVISVIAIEDKGKSKVLELVK